MHIFLSEALMHNSAIKPRITLEARREFTTEDINCLALGN